MLSVDFFFGFSHRSIGVNSERNKLNTKRDINLEIESYVKTVSNIKAHKCDDSDK